MKKVINILSVLFLSLFASYYAYGAAYSWTERYVNNTLYTGTKPTGTATGGGNDYILLEAGSEGADDAYNDYGIMLTGGTGTDGESRRIIDYDATGHGSGECYAQVDAAWTVNPDATTTYEITDGSDSNDGTAAGKYDGANGAWRTLNYAADNCAQGQCVNIKGGREYDLEQIMSCSVTGGVDNAICFAGYTSSVRDGGNAILDAQSALTYCIDTATTSVDNIIFRDLELKGSTDDAFYSGSSGSDYMFIYKCKITNAGDFGIYSTGTLETLENEITACTDIALHNQENSRIAWNYVHDTSSYGISAYWMCCFNIIDDTENASLYVNDRGWVFNNTCYDAAGDNIDHSTNREFIHCFNNIFHTAGDYNIDGAAGGNFRFLGYNNLYGGSTGTIDPNVIIIIDETANDQTGDPDLVDPTNATASSRDFNLGSSTTIDDDGIPDNFPGITNTDGHMEMGATPYEETGGGTTVHEGAISVVF